MSNFEEVSFSPLSPAVIDFDEPINGKAQNKISNSLNSNVQINEPQVNFAPGNSTHWGASFNFINSIVGAGIIGK
jgi:hypothetical protein